MSSGLIDIMKRAAMDVMNNSQICDLRYGTVVSVTPLKIQVTNVFTLPESLLVVPQHLTEYELEITPIDWLTEDRSGGGGDASFASHNHAISGKKKIKVHNALKVGDKVALLRKQGGQSYFVLDRII
jgi:hypothetical protein